MKIEALFEVFPAVAAHHHLPETQTPSAITCAGGEEEAERVTNGQEPAEKIQRCSSGTGELSRRHKEGVECLKKQEGLSQK